jgi:hypothetical protein
MNTEAEILVLEATRSKHNPAKYVRLLQQSNKLGSRDARLYLMRFYLDCNLFGKFIKYAIKVHLVPDFLETSDYSVVECECYWRVGREVFFATDYVNALLNRKVTVRMQIFCRRIFVECNQKAQACIFTWLLCCKKWGFQKDVARLIGKIIWKNYRKDPTYWDIWEVEENKKLKRG